MNGVTSRRRRQRVCSKDGAREGERQRKGETGKKREVVRVRRLLLLEVRSTVHRRALAPIHHLPVRHQSGASCGMFTAVGAKGRRGENGKILLPRCGHRLREFQIVLEMHKKKRTGSADS